MTGLFSAINSATAGLRAIQTDLKLVSDNVARADDPTRTRHSVARQTGPSGAIVGVSFQRRTDNALQAQLNQAIASDAGGSTRNAYLSRVGEALGTAFGEPPLQVAMQQFAEAWRSLQTTPESNTAQLQVIQLGERVAREVQRTANSVEQIDTDIRTDIGKSVDELNRMLGEIDRLNTEIVAHGNEGAVGNEMRDQRDAMVRDLNRLIGARTLEQPNGELTVFTSDGLLLLDSEPAQFSYDGANAVRMVTAQDRDIDVHFSEGKIGALLDMVRDGSQESPPQPPSKIGHQEVIRKLRSQLDAVVEAFTGPTQTGQPTSFADAYDNASPVETGELNSGFFVGTNRFDVQVNPSLLDGTKSLKAAAIEDAAEAVTIAGRTFSVDGVEATNASYTDFVSATMGYWSDAARVAEEESARFTETKELLEIRFQSKVGINLDEEIAQLQMLQTSYAASARVIQVTNTMFNALESIVS